VAPEYEGSSAPRVDTLCLLRESENLLHPLQEHIRWKWLRQVRLPGSVKLDNPIGASGQDLISRAEVVN
jgi:hypothetical protein